MVSHSAIPTLITNVPDIYIYIYIFIITLMVSVAEKGIQYSFNLQYITLGAPAATSRPVDTCH